MEQKLLDWLALNHAPALGAVLEKGRDLFPFVDHNEVVHSVEEMRPIYEAVARDLEMLAMNIRLEDAYAEHVQEITKDNIFRRDIDIANDVRYGHWSGFAHWQRINQKLTGECVALLPK